MRNRFLTGRRRARFQADMPEDAIDRLLSVAENQDAAVQLGIPEGTSKSRVACGRTRLRRLIKEQSAPLFYNRQAADQARAERPRPRRDWTGVMIG